MTVLEMHRLIEQDIQKMGMFAYKDLETEEIDLQINRQVNLIIEGILDKYYGRKLKVNEEQGFQQNQVSLDNLRKLQVGNANQTLVYLGDEVSFTLPNNYYHHIRTNVTTSYICYEDGKEVTKTKQVNVRIVNSQDDWKNRPFHKTGLDSPVAEIVGTGLFIYKDSTFNIDSARLTYIKKPAIVTYAKNGEGNYDANASIQCDLDDSLHYMLVDMTSIRIMKILESNPQKVVSLEQETL